MTILFLVLLVRTDVFGSSICGDVFVYASLSSPLVGFAVGCVFLLLPFFPLTS